MKKVPDVAGFVKELFPKMTEKNAGDVVKADETSQEESRKKRTFNQMQKTLESQKPSYKDLKRRKVQGLAEEKKVEKVDSKLVEKTESASAAKVVDALPTGSTRPDASFLASLKQ